MNSLKFNARAKLVDFIDNDMYVELFDGRKLYIPLIYFPRLSNASDFERKQYEISGGGVGIHWDNLDEDISVEGLLYGIGDRTAKNNMISSSL